MIRTFRISYKDRWGHRIEEPVAAFDASSALRVFRYIRPDVVDVKCEEEQGEPGALVNLERTVMGESLEIKVYN